MVERLKNLQTALERISRRVNEQDAIVRRYPEPVLSAAQVAPLGAVESYEIVENYYRKMTSAYEGRRRAREELAVRAAKLRQEAI